MFPASVRRDDNPFIPILTDALAACGVVVCDYTPGWIGVPDALHIHWLEGVFWGRVPSRFLPWAAVRARRLVALVRAVHRAGRPVVWTVHNLHPHDFRDSRHAAIYERLSRDVLPLVTDVICMNRSVEPQVRAEYPALAQARFHQIPHPHYIDYFGSRLTALPPEAVDFLAPEAVPTLGMFGMIRPYKGIPDMIRRLRASALRFRLIVGGEGPLSELDAVRAAMGDDPRFLLVARRLAEPELSALVKACNLTLFNFQKVLNTGSVLTALSLGTPVLAPRTAALEDLAQGIGPPLIHTFEGQITAQAVTRILEAIEGADMQVAVHLAPFDPSRIAAQIKVLYAGQGSMTESGVLGI